MKKIHRQIVTSTTYRQSSVQNDAAMAIDAENRLHWRMSPRRLEAEEIRDAMLQVAGLLVVRVGGRGYRDVRDDIRGSSHFYNVADQDQPEQFRRTLYRFSPRGAGRNLLDTFDCPDPSAIAPRRASTTTPLQSLSLMNNAFVLMLADSFADRLTREAVDDIDGQVHRGFELAYSRPANTDDYDLARPFIREHGLSAYCRVLFNSNEFLYVP